MSDPYQQRNQAYGLEQTRVIERPGGVTGFDTFYATGTWTPAFAGTTIAGTFTYAGQVGKYTRIGDQVHVHAYVQISAIAVAPTGSMIVSGLPFTAASVAVDFSLYMGFIDNVNYSATAKELLAMVRLGTTDIWLSESFDNAAWARYPAANFTNALAGIELSGFYQV